MSLYFSKQLKVFDVLNLFMRTKFFKLKENEETFIQDKNLNFSDFIIKNEDGSDTQINLKSIFGTEFLRMTENPNTIQVIPPSHRYASETYEGYKLVDRGRTFKNIENSYKDSDKNPFKELVGKNIYKVDAGKPCYKFLGLKRAIPNDRHVVFLLQPFNAKTNKFKKTFKRFEARLGSNARGLTEEKEAASWINKYFGIKNELAAYPNEGDFFGDDSLKNVEGDAPEGQKESFKRWFDPILKRSKSWRCFMRNDLKGLREMVKELKLYKNFDIFNQSDFFILSNDLIEKLASNTNQTISNLNNEIKEGNLFPISYKNSSATNLVGFISNGNRSPISTTGVVNVWEKKLKPLTDPRVKTYAKFWVSGISTFPDNTYTINVVLNIYDVPEDNLNKKHFLVGVNLRSAGNSKCVAETSLKAYTQVKDSDEIIEVDSAGQGGKITNLLPSETGDGEDLVSEYFKSEKGWKLDLKYKTENKEETLRSVMLSQIGFGEGEYSFINDNNNSKEKTIGLINYLKGNKNIVIENSQFSRSDFFFEIEPQKVLDLLKIVYRIRDPLGSEDASLDYYKWESRKKHRLSLNEKIKIAEAKVRIEERNLKRALQNLKNCTKR